MIRQLGISAVRKQKGGQNSITEVRLGRGIGKGERKMQP